MQAVIQVEGAPGGRHGAQGRRHKEGGTRGERAGGGKGVCIGITRPQTQPSIL